MATLVPQPRSTAPNRGGLTRTWSEIAVMAGFMDDGHVQKVLAEYLAVLPPAEREAISKAVATARSMAAALTPIDFSTVLTRPLACPEVDAIRADPVFAGALQGRLYRFSWVRADRLIAVQTSVHPRRDPVPTDEKGLIDFCLPHHWDIPVDIFFTPPNGPIQIVSSAPTLSGVRIEKDGPNGRVILSPVPHINLILVREFKGRHYLINGYHRVFNLLARGRTEIPALVYSANQPSELEIGPDGFSAGHLMALARPPLVADFLGQAAIPAKAQASRSGLTINLDIKPFVIGI